MKSVKSWVRRPAHVGVGREIGFWFILNTRLLGLHLTRGHVTQRIFVPNFVFF